MRPRIYDIKENSHISFFSCFCSRFKAAKVEPTCSTRCEYFKTPPISDQNHLEPQSSFTQHVQHTVSGCVSGWTWGVAQLRRGSCSQGCTPLPTSTVKTARPPWAGNMWVQNPRFLSDRVLPSNSRWILQNVIFFFAGEQKLTARKLQKGETFEATQLWLLFNMTPRVQGLKKGFSF